VLPNLSLKVRSAARPVLVVPFAFLLLGIAFAILAPRYSPAAASGYALARVSLLRILVPFVAVLIVPVTAYGGFGEIGEIPVGWFVPVGVELMLAAWLVLSPTRMVLVGLGSRGSCRSGHGDHLALRCDRSEPHDLRCRPCCLTCA